MHRAMMCVKEFNKKYGIDVNDTPHLPDEETMKRRMKLLENQYHEYRYAERGADLVKISDALADMAYVICGTALEYGIPLPQIFIEVHRSNMTREEPSVKGQEFSAPKIAEILCKEIYGED